MKKLCYISILMLFLFLTSSCCFNKQKEHVPESLKQYFCFQEGSYWIYKNQFEQYDTLTVIYFASEMDLVKFTRCDYVEEIRINYRSSLVWPVSAWTSHYPNEPFYFCNEGNHYFAGLISEEKNESGGNDFYICHGLHIEQRIVDSIFVGNEYYYNVLISKDIDQYIDNPKHPLICYYKENIGMIRRELVNGEIWELIEYQVRRK